MPQALDGRRGASGCSTSRCAAVRRRRAALIAGAVLALPRSPTLMFRFNNPDALLVLLLVGAGVRD